MVASQQLPAKDQAVFRSIVKFYETKQYKKGVKAADSILKKHPEHGETLCMKGLALSYLDKKEEAYALVRQGLRYDLKSHVCWHVFGLLYRQDKDYHEASKCYLQALRFDADNIQILRDLSLLQIHRRDLHGFAETRRKLLQAKPSNRLNWIGYAVAEHLCKNNEFAWTSIDNYEKTFKNDDSVPAYENSELFLYKATIMEEAGKFEEALETLKQHEKQIVDKIGLLEMKGRLCMFLGRHSEAADIYMRLIRINPEQHIYVLAYLANKPEFQRFWPPLPAPAVVAKNGEEEGDASTGTKDESKPMPATISSFSTTVHPSGMPVWGWLAPEVEGRRPSQRVVIGNRQHKRRVQSYEPLVPLTDEEQESIIKCFDEFQSEFPKADSFKQIILYFLNGDRFQRKADAFMRARIRKGVPSLFRMMRPLCFQPGKAKLIEDLLVQYTKCLAEEPAWFGPEVGASNTARGDEPEEEPSSLLFALMVTADHFDFMGDTSKALEYCNAAIEHTPTLVELYACKGRIYKHTGDLKEAAKWFDEARSMDLADRFLNTQCARALIRVDDTDAGKEKALMFSKDPDSPESANLHDMQCMWYESAMGRSFTRQGKYGKALKKFNETFKHFNDIAEDQFDFHNYCLRKTTLKAYVGMLRMQERLYSHKFYRRAAKDAVRIHLELYDRKLSGQADAAAAAEGEPKEADMSAAEKKKLKHKLQREKKAKEDKAAQQQANQTAGAGGKPKKVDEDPDGEKLLEKDQMEQAVKLVKQLALFSSEDAATHILTYDVFARQGKLLPCLHALLRLWRFAGCDNLNYKLIAPLTHFCFVLDLENDATPQAVRQVVMTEAAPMLGASAKFDSVASLRKAATKVVDAVEKRLRETKDLPLIEVLYSLKCLKHAGKDTKSFLDKWRPEGAFSIKECRKMLDYLEKQFGKDSSIRENFKKSCLERFPLMVIA
eukprot:TRINITY_DN13002_c0_g2_i1.p1 TRINITY_DN13002_c0_g2~~TRINITY_DN13002_c0_g2_i1.p1  ORF type:complete len:946 (+),score=235.53 TRINITY_DN13002_c0_g2_i1:170-3007(+)